MRRLFTLTLALGLVLAGAGTLFAQDVRYNFDNKADFTKFKTYKWVALKGGPPLSDLLDRQIKSTVDAELAKKGLTSTDADSADLYIGYQSAIDTEKLLTAYGSNWGYGPGWYGAGWYGSNGATMTGQTSTIYVGQLAVDIYASSPQQLVWRGVASKTLDRNAKPEKQQKNLAKAVAKLLKNYPPPAKKS
jgi:hypothetical protein